MPKKSSKTSANRSSILGTKNNFQSPTHTLKIDLTSKNKEKISIPPIANGKGMLGPCSRYLKLKNSKGSTKHFTFLKFYHRGFTDHGLGISAEVTYGGAN